MKPELFISPSETIRTALKKMDLNACQILLVVDDNRCLLGTLSDGDIRRLILAGTDISDSIGEQYHKNALHLNEGLYSSQDARDLLILHKIRLLPVIDCDQRVVGIETWEHAFAGEDLLDEDTDAIDIDVVIMAGGKGTRLAPFTDVLPKPLIPVGSKTILEHIIDGFAHYQARKYYLTINYRGEMIRAYLDSIDKQYEAHFLKEEHFCGTAGALTLLPEDVSDPFIVSNCDILVKANYMDVLQLHRNSNAHLTMVSSIHHHAIPYGVVQCGSGGSVLSVDEKPEYTVQINTGVYILNKECLKYIKSDCVFHMTHLIDVLIADGKKVVAYPVNEREYIDIGQWDEYKKAMDRIR